MEQTRIFAGFVGDVEERLNNWMRENSEKINITTRIQNYNSLSGANPSLNQIAISVWYIRKDEQPNPPIV